MYLPAAPNIVYPLIGWLGLKLKLTFGLNYRPCSVQCIGMFSFYLHCISFHLEFSESRESTVPLPIIEINKGKLP